MNPTETQALAAYQVPDSRIAELRTKVERLARRAAKLGMPAIVLAEVRPGPRTASRRVPAGRGQGYKLQEFQLPCTWIELAGPSPVLSGYTFLARLEHTAAGNLVSRVVGAGDEIDLTAYRSAKPVCDHCKHKRTRKDTFVLRAPDGALKQIGRNCLADYLRSEQVEVVLALLALTDELSRSTDGEDEPDEGGGGGGGGWRLITSVESFLAASAIAVRLFGWVSRQALRSGYQGQSTADRARFISGKKPTDRESAEDWEREQPTIEDVAYSARVLDWIKASTDASDYMYNLRVAAAQPAVTGRTEGLLASAIGAYQREVEKKIAERAKPKAESAHVGEIGARLSFRLTVVRRLTVETAYGGLTIHVLEDERGNVFVWKTGSAYLEQERTYDVKGTVKKHSDYKGRKQTELARCKATEVKIDAPEQEKSA